jgi:hypothetical protein
MHAPACVRRRPQLARLTELEKTYFNPDRGRDDGSAAEAAENLWGGYWGPFEFP